VTAKRSEKPNGACKSAFARFAMSPSPDHDPDAVVETPNGARSSAQRNAQRKSTKQNNIFFIYILMRVSAWRLHIWAKKIQIEANRVPF
jgi:hypothetical protein